MEEQMKESLIRIEYLEKLIDYMQQNLNLTWAILAVIVAILAVTAAILIKTWVNKKVEEQLDSIKKELIELWKTNPQFYYDKGIAQLIMFRFGEANLNYYEYAISVRDNFNISFPTRINLYYMIDDEKIHITNYKIKKINKNSLQIGFDIDSIKTGIEAYGRINLNYELLWENPIYREKE